MMKRAVFILLAMISVQAEGFKNNIDLLMSEGEEGWMEKVIEKGKVNGQNHNEGLARETRTATDQFTSEEVTPKIQALDLALNNDFQSSAVDRPKRWLGKLKEDWDSKAFNERQARATALIGAVNNIPKLANAKEDPVGAVQGALGIMASVAQVAGPTGQLVSIGFMFASSLLSLFGQGKQPKPMGEIVREQINEALSEFHEQQISDEAEAAIFALQISKAYVDGAGRNRDKISDNDVNPLATNVPVLSGLRVMGLLATQIVNLKTANNPGDAEKCFKYVELYCKLATLRSMIISQVIGLIPDSFPGTIDGYANARVILKDATKSMLSFLYDPNEGNKLMPYFDGEKYPFANGYLEIALGIPRPNHFPGSGYCITGHRPGINYLGKYFVRTVIPTMTHPLAQVSGAAYCRWRLVPHGNNLFSIISDDGMLSYDHDSRRLPRVTIERDNPVLWEIRSSGGSSSYWIKIKYFCANGNRCNYGLRYKYYNYYYMRAGRSIGTFFMTIDQPITVGYLHRVSNSMTPWSIYKRPSDMPSTDDDVNGNEKSDKQDFDESWAKPGENSEIKNATEPIINMNRTETNQTSNQQPKKSEDLSHGQRQNDGDEEILTKEGEEGWLEKLLQKAKSKGESSNESPSSPPKQESRKTVIRKKKHGHKKGSVH